MSSIESETNDNMPITTTTISAIIIKNLLWLSALAFYPLVDWVISVVPDWKEWLENFKLIGGAIIIVLVVTKLWLEIKKLKKDK